MQASKSCRREVAGFVALPVLNGASIPLQLQPEFAPPEAGPGGTIAKRPAVGPTSRLLRVFLHDRLDGWRDRMTGECPDAPSPVPEDGQGPVLDENALKAFCANLSAPEAREFVWLCIVDTELRLTDIIARRAAGDLESMAEIAHGIAREAARLGAIRVHVLALRLETACRGGSIGPYSLISELSDAWAKVGDTLCAWLARQGSLPAA